MDFSTLLILALVFVVMGVALDNLVRYLLKEMGSTKEEQATHKPQENKPPDGYIEEARILRDVGRRLALQIQGKIYRAPGALSEEQRQQIDRLHAELSLWLDRPTTLKTQTPVPQSSSLNESGLPETANVSRPILNPVNMLVNAVQTDVRPLEKSLSLADQVDTILQEILSTSPLKGRGIRLTEGLDGGVVVMVGLEKYEGVEAVPDEEVRKAIRSAAEEWRKRSSAK